MIAIVYYVSDLNAYCGPTKHTLEEYADTLLPNESYLRFVWEVC